MKDVITDQNEKIKEEMVKVANSLEECWVESENGVVKIFGRCDKLNEAKKVLGSMFPFGEFAVRWAGDKFALSKINNLQE